MDRPGMQTDLCNLKERREIIRFEYAGSVAGEGYGYLKSFMWWTGMTLSKNLSVLSNKKTTRCNYTFWSPSTVIVGELCNFIAYSFTPAILVTPLGALSVVVAWVDTLHRVEQDFSVPYACISLSGPCYLLFFSRKDSHSKANSDAFNASLAPSLLCFMHRKKVLQIHR